MLTVRLATSPVDLAAAFLIRHQVFVVEQGVPLELELDERDDDDATDHVIAVDDGEVVAAGRLVEEAAGFEGIDVEAGPVGHLGRLAVSDRHRGLGLGVALVGAIEQRAQQRGLPVIYLSSQTHAVAFYERLGYAVYGEEFDDAGIPHRHMRKLLL
ncbi:MAG: GNAT family N-acetyltransferase [Candidatus Nanopelagicales bacterium]